MLAFSDAAECGTTTHLDSSGKDGEKDEKAEDATTSNHHRTGDTISGDPGREKTVSLLFSKKDGLGCLFLKEAKTLLISEKRFGVHLVDVWINQTVALFKCSYPKKFYIQSNSITHKGVVVKEDL